VEEVFAANQQAVRDALSNPRKTQAAVGFLRGQVMRASGGRADARLAGRLIEERLSHIRKNAG
jgi:aspartyl-tRNA(Asn)/glutamyl-tRNA(Gln) amidotransferase subunit B